MVFAETLRRLSRHGAFAGILLMAAAVLAMPVANSPLLPACDGFLAAKPAIPLNGTGLARPLILSQPPDRADWPQIFLMMPMLA